MIRQITDDVIRRDFISLMAEVEAGSWFDMANTVHSAWLQRRVSRRIGSGGNFYALYSPEGSPLGLSCLLIEGHPIVPGHSEILDMGVVEGHRRQGYGTQLVEDAVHRAAAAGACCIYVSTYAGDANAVAFYTHTGFRIVAEHPGLNGPDDRGQVYMMKELGQKMHAEATSKSARSTAPEASDA